MKYRDLNIQTQRETPKNARTEGFSFLVRAGYFRRENIPTQLGEHTIDHLSGLASNLGGSFLSDIGLQVIGNENEAFFPIAAGPIEVAHCPSCKYTERLELARLAKAGPRQEGPLPLEKVITPGCNTIELLANFLGIPREKTAKALLFTRLADNKFIFVVVRGDMQLSESKFLILAEFVVLGKMRHDRLKTPRRASQPCLNESVPKQKPNLHLQISASHCRLRWKSIERLSMIFMRIDNGLMS